MEDRKFEDICRRSRMVPIHKESTPGGDILVAEGYFNIQPEFDRPHWKTVWAVRREGMDVARPLYFEFGGGSTQESRIAAAVADARQFITDNRTVGRYG
jgi:hypothetical protein